MAVKIGINGFGRIGKLVLRASRGTDIEVVAVNDLTEPATLAHLLKYDSLHGAYPGDVTYDDKSITVEGKKILVLSERDPANLRWGDLGVDIVVESTGRFTSKESVEGHIKAGAKKVLISAPAKGHDGTFVPGVNADQYDPKKHHIISIGSCTTNCLAPVVKIALDNFGIENGFMTTIHAYTNDQNILDAPHKDLRRARGGAMSLIPTSTGAAKAIAQVIPETAGKLDGCAVRAPVPLGSLVDLALLLGKSVSRDEINEVYRSAANGAYKGILSYCVDPIVSCDVIGDPHSSIFDSAMTMANGKLVKLFSWYDNEWGFANRLVETLPRML